MEVLAEEVVEALRYRVCLKYFFIEFDLFIKNLYFYLDIFFGGRGGSSSRGGFGGQQPYQPSGGSGSKDGGFFSDLSSFFGKCCLYSSKTVTLKLLKK